MSALGFIERVCQDLQNRGYLNDWNASNLATAIVHIMNNPTPPQPPPWPVPIQEIEPGALDKVPNDRMIFEMLKRGFAVMKVPESGKPAPLEDV